MDKIEPTNLPKDVSRSMRLFGERKIDVTVPTVMLTDGGAATVEVVSERASERSEAAAAAAMSSAVQITSD